MEGVANWEKLTWQEKREARFKKWLDAPGVEFVHPAARQAYRERVTRFIKVINLEEPDRVPFMLPAGYLPASYAGYNLKTVMYDYEKLAEAWRKFNRDFQPDLYSGPGLVYPGRVVEKIGHKLHKWPGHGLPDDASMYQYIEGVYMNPEEYDDLNANPTDFWMRVFLPRTGTAFEPFKYFPPFNPIMTNSLAWVMTFSRPEVQQAFETLIEAGKEIGRWAEAVGAVSREMLAEGFPSFASAMAGAPFDNLADVLRGTQGIVMDMFRRPQKIHETMEKLVPLIIKGVVRGVDMSLSPVVTMPLHKGDKSFMSPRQFEEFYWPTYKKVLMGMINEGLVPMPFAEGNYEPRLDIIKEMPRTAVIWYFEVMDMAKAKQVLGNVSCIAGNIPASLVATSTPTVVKEACRRLIETCAKGGGYILAGGASVSKGNPDNLRAVMDAAREYGTYPLK
jgi:uroporphyrinogen-III decarboxylase